MQVSSRRRAATEVWMAAAEAAPLAQVGGLGDVLRALPAALQGHGIEVRRFLPAYGCVRREGFEYERGSLSVALGSGRERVRFLSGKGSDGVRTTLVECDGLFGRQGIYGTPEAEYPDSARRFTLFCRAVYERARLADRPPDILHAHDWHAALIPLFVRFACPWRRRPRTVLTVHNVGYQGRFHSRELDLLALDDALRDRLFRPDGIEYYGDVCFLKAGLLYADRVTTVSPTHAREIQGPEYGFGLHGVVQQRAQDLVGILNGADYDIWNPATDCHLPRCYDSTSLAGKLEAQRELRRRFGLRSRRRPILGVVSRLVHQKGIDVFLQAVPSLLELGVDVVVLGSGDSTIKKTISIIQKCHPGHVGLVIGFHEALSHLVVAGSDFLMVPSRYEPCGLIQMHALRYGTIPIVHQTGGLADTVRHEQVMPGQGTGFVFEKLTPARLTTAVRQAVGARRADPANWRAVQLRAMAENFSWEKAAARYIEVYQELLGAGTGARAPEAAEMSL